MWQVEFETPLVEKEIEALIKLGKISAHDQVIIAAWVRQIYFYGPGSISEPNKWSDHKLYGNWKGYRSSAFSNRGRIVYRVDVRISKVFIARITDAHDYRKKD